MKYLLDTHVAVWWAASDRRLDRNHARILGKAAIADLGLSAISLWELAMLAARGRFSVSLSAAKMLADLDNIALTLPLTPAIAVESTRLGDRMHGDPADQLIVATARCHLLTLLTSDRKLIESGLVLVA
jgi:PIN domain nuclease of toxin-antitoxin system